MTQTTEPPIAVIPPFVLPDLRGNAFNTARLRGRRHAILLFLAPADPDTAACLQSFAARRDELAWLHTAVVAIVPADADATALSGTPFPVLRDDGRVRARVLPGVAPESLALLVADQYGQIMTWRTARRAASLPDAETALAWAWEVARPKGSCGGVTWAATASPPASTAPPAPVGRFTVGTTHRRGYRRHGSALAVHSNGLTAEH